MSSPVFIDKTLGKFTENSKNIAHNVPAVYASPLRVSGSEKPQSAYGLYAIFLRHILTRRNAMHCFIGGPKRRKQPEHYVQCPLT
jgi:hypothetical protein